jgi:putative ABC transport system permease protein
VRPLHAGAPVTVRKTADDDPEAPRISAQEVTPEFFAALQIPIVAGRGFDGRDTAGAAPAVILNARTAADLYGNPAAAIGQRIRLDEEAWREVVGVVGNVRSTFFNRLEWQLDPIIYKPAAQGFASVSNPMATSFGFMLHVRTQRPLTFAEVRRAALAISPRAAVTELRAVPELIAEATTQPAFRMTLLSWFAAASVLLSAIGVYALVSQGVNQRLRELAIRIALGARPADVVREVTGRAVAIAAAGLVLGTLAAFALGEVMRSLLYGVTPNDAFSLAAAATLLLAMTTAAAMIPARRVTRIDPARALRAE